MSPPISVSDAENLQSEIDEEVASLLDGTHSGKVRDNHNTEGDGGPTESKKKKRSVRIPDSTDEDGYDEDEETDSYARSKKSRRSKKKQQGPTQTLLKFLDGEGGKKQVSFELNKKKKRKNSKRLQTGEDGDDGTAFEDLIRSLRNYKKSCPTCTSVQVFLMSK